MRRFLTRSGILGALILGGTRLAAQGVDLRVRDQSSGAAVAGAIVRLLDAQRAVDRGLTDERGRIVLRAPRPGSYRLRLDRIGFRGLSTSPFVLDSGRTVAMTVDMPSDRVSLPTLEVRGRSRCDTRGNGTLAATLWEEVQKALTANLITQSGRQVPLHLREFVREAGRDGRSIREWVVVSRIVRGPPFNAFPAALLDSAGYVYETGDSATFAVPDAALLLSDEFVAGHCFYAVQGTGMLAGLGFTPIRSRRLPDVTGTLWLDRESLALRSLDYTYTGLPGVLGSLKLGGRLEFSQLPNGRWMVSYWHVRMPRISEPRVVLDQGAPRAVDVEGYFDRGGRAEVAGDTLGLIHRAMITGRVYDSTENRGLEGVVVWIRGLGDSMRTDANGQFFLTVDASGDRFLGVRHPKLNLLREASAVPVLLSLGDTTRVRLGVPSLATLERHLCRRPEPGRVSLMGVAYNANGTRAARRNVSVVRRTDKGPEDDPHFYQPIHGVDPALVADDGLYCVGNVPIDAHLVVTLKNGKLTLFEGPVTIARTSRWLEIHEWGSPDSAVAPFRVRPPRGPR